jgi:two-component system, NarL family, response regulator DevR
MPDVIHVVLADDHDLIRGGLKATLRAFPEFSVVGEARDGLEAVKEALRLRPELVVMDVRMPKLGGIEACREIRSQAPEINVLVLTSFADERAVMSAIVAGASGFMLKDVRTDDLVAAMRTVGRGGKTLDPASSAAIIDQLRKGTFLSPEQRQAAELSERERKILTLIAEGLTNREIAAQVYLSEKTVKHHVSDILAKLGVSRRSQAASFAVRLEAQQSPEDAGG